MNRAKLIKMPYPINGECNLKECKTLSKHYCETFLSVRKHFLSVAIEINKLTNVELDETKMNKLKNVLQELYNVDMRLVDWFKTNAYLLLLRNHLETMILSTRFHSQPIVQRNLIHSSTKS